MRRYWYILALCVGLSGFLPSGVWALDYACEVMTVQGQAYVTQGDLPRRQVQEGDLLKANDLLEVEKGGQVDLAFDRDWENITRIWESSRVRIKSIYPTGLNLDRGDVFSKLGNLPAGSTFEIQTPTAVAAVRGTEFLTSVEEGGRTSVVGFDHAVEVFNLDASGKLGERVLVNESEKTVVNRIGAPPALPVKAPQEDLQKVMESSANLHQEVESRVQEGRLAKIQSAGSVEAMLTLAQVYKESRAGDSAEKGERSDDRRPAGDGNGPGPGSAKGSLDTQQTQQLKDRFIQLGGNANDFSLMNEKMKNLGVSAGNFDRFKETFSAHMDSPGSFREPLTSDAMGPRVAAMDPGKMEERLPFRDSEPLAVKQIQDQIDRTLTTTELIQNDPCLSDPNKCYDPNHGGSTGP